MLRWVRALSGAFGFAPPTEQRATTGTGWPLKADDDSPHQVTVAQGTPAEFRTGVILKGQTGGFRFDHVGTYNYIYGFHPGMKGIIEVQ